jgi:hypothetical protein
MEQDEDENMKRWEDNELTPWKTWEDGKNSLKGSNAQYKGPLAPKIK